MEHLYPLLILLSGATIVLLGSFLLASERELKKKRREIDEFKRKRTAVSDTSTDARHSEMHSSEAIGKNDELLQEISALSSRLEESERMLAGQNDHSLWLSAQSENRQLQEKIDNLEREIGMMHEQLETLQSQLGESARRNQEAAEWNERLQIDLSDQRQAAVKELQDAERRVQEAHENYRTQLDAMENRLQESVRQYHEVSDRCARVEAEAADYRQQLERSQSMARESAAAQEQGADVESRETSYQEQQQKLEALIGDLERELSEGKSQVEALEETHQRLRETEQICLELGDENRRLGEDIARWQQRLAESEENQKQVSLLRQQIDALQTEHARVIDNNRRMQVDLAADGEAIRVSSPVESDADGAMIIQSKIQGIAGLSSDLTGSDEAHRHVLGSSDAAPVNHAAKKVNTTQIVWRTIARNWHFGAVFASVIILVIAGAVAMKILATERSDTERGASDNLSRLEVSVSRDPVAAVAPEATPVEPSTAPAAKPAIKAAPRLRGAFQTVRPTQVFSGPSENAALIANIGQGMKLNVVDSRDGWLEIRSKHGRPPGFVRQEAAVRIGSN